MTSVQETSSGRSDEVRPPAAEAEAIFREMARKQPKNPEILFYLGSALYD